ncbi:hypothetical protein FSARC_10662 [Fusarium sarcochroum]|uniref:RTM1 protein n=1 Tax=Fusarium sarcochroum TaxID=1208366 RepID=A0A8H4X369_9HYPO|nr:hypothetical protein FSARC_10662 [Fusarium sarcochroum]
MAALELYHYDPTFTPAVVVLGLTWFFIPFLFGCAIEVLGYSSRAISARESPNWSTLPYAIQTFTLLLGPTMMTATIYMILSRLIMALDADIYSLVPVKGIPKTFIFGDIVSLAAQFTGAGILVNAKSVNQQRTGQLIIVGGLAFQIYFFGFFTSVLHIVHSRITDNATRQSAALTSSRKRLIWVLYLVCGLILSRSIYRVIEYATGPNGIVQATEIYFYVFDAGFIWTVSIILTVYHPRQLASIPKENLKDLETVHVTPSKPPPPRYQSPQTPPRYMQQQPPPFLPSYSNLRNLGPYYHPPSQYRTQSFIQYPPPLHYYQQRRPPTLAHYRPRTNRTNKSFDPSLSSSSSVVSIYNPYTGQYEPIRR